VAFNESEVLRAFDPAAGCITNFTGATVKLWYNDEHVLTLGVHDVVFKEFHCGNTAGGAPCGGSSGGTCAVGVKCGTTAFFSASFKHSDVTPMGVPDALGASSAHNPLTGISDSDGNDTNVCTGDPDCGRPMRPSLFITDISVAANPRHGDWQYHGDQTLNNPNDVFGTWKGATRFIDHTVSPAGSGVTPDDESAVQPNGTNGIAKNNWHLGTCSGGATCDNAPAGLTNQGYGAEVRWDVLPTGGVGGLRNTDTTDPGYGQLLIPNHTYRFQFIVHDGDQNKVGGDTGEACVNAQYQSGTFGGPTLAVISGGGQKQSLLAGLLRSLSEQTSRILLNLAW
jgi:hypothetical protein